MPPGRARSVSARDAQLLPVYLVRWEAVLVWRRRPVKLSNRSQQLSPVRPNDTPNFSSYAFVKIADAPWALVRASWRTPASEW